MLETKRTSHLIALVGALALLAGAPAHAQTAAPAAPAAATAAPAAPDAAAPAAAPADTSGEGAEGLKVGGSANGKLTPIVMFLQADLVVKIVMIGLLACSIGTWMLLVIKLVEFGSLRR